MTPSPLVRASFQSDVPAIAAIYAHYVLHGTASFELVPPDAQEIAQRRQQVLERGLPYLVTEIDYSVVAYAYAAPYRTRPGYRFTVEDSIYVHPDFVGQGIGRLLLCALIEALRKLPAARWSPSSAGKTTKPPFTFIARSASSTWAS